MHARHACSSSNATCWQFVGQSMPREGNAVPVMEVAAIIEALQNNCKILTTNPYTVLGQPRLLGCQLHFTLVVENFQEA